MIGKRKLHHVAELAKPVGQAEIVRGGGDVAGGMIVGNDKLHRAEEQRIPEDNLRIDDDVVHRTGGKNLESRHLAGDVQDEQNEMFLVVVELREDRANDLAHVLAVADGQEAEAIFSGDQRIDLDGNGLQRSFVHGIDQRKVDDGSAVTLVVS